MEFHSAMLLTTNRAPIGTSVAVFLISIQLNYRSDVEAPLFHQSVALELVLLHRLHYHLVALQPNRNRYIRHDTLRTDHNTRNNSYQVRYSISPVGHQFRECSDLYIYWRWIGGAGARRRRTNNLDIVFMLAKPNLFWSRP